MNKRLPLSLTWRRYTAPALGVCASFALASLLGLAHAQTPQDPKEKSIEQQVHSLRKLPDNERARVTKQLALDIRQLTQPSTRLGLASGLANLATEGDFGHDTLQEVATTLAEALRAQPSSTDPKQLEGSYVTLAQLVRYENVTISGTSAPLTDALAKLEAADKRREQADFTLTDLAGKKWTLKSLRGQVVLVNFWATWCPPCRKEIPDLAALYEQFKDQGLIILGISDEEMDKVKPFVAQNKMPYPVLLDPGRKVNDLFEIQSIPRNFIFDRNGKLAAQAIDMRTRRQFLTLLAKAGLKPTPEGVGKAGAR